MVSRSRPKTKGPWMEIVAPHVRLLAGRPAHAVNVYLVDDVLVDAGSPAAPRRVLRQIASADVRALALTHEHPDHYGGARTVCRSRQIELWASPGVADAISARRASAGNTAIGRVLQRLPGPPSHPVARLLREGDELAAGFEALETPGHAPAHLAFWRAEDRVLIAGDVVFLRSVVLGRTGLREPPRALTHDHERNRESIRRIAELEPRVLLAGHGPPLREPQRELWALAKRVGTSALS